MTAIIYRLKAHLSRLLGLTSRNLSQVKLFLTDIDGTLTDGGMYYTAQGDYMKKFYARDGMGLKLLQQHGVKVGIVTSEDTAIVTKRSEKLALDFLMQGRKGAGKARAAKEICASMGITMNQVVYVGDDINDAEILRSVGHPCCPSDAAIEIISIPGILITKHGGGKGCVRELANMIIKAKSK